MKRRRVGTRWDDMDSMDLDEDDGSDDDSESDDEMEGKTSILAESPPICLPTFAELVLTLAEDALAVHIGFQQLALPFGFSQVTQSLSLTPIFSYLLVLFSR